jgi:hypothetical protein
MKEFTMLAALAFFIGYLVPQAQNQAPQKELVVTCAVNPAVVAPGGAVGIAAKGFSAQNRHMSFSFKATAGRVSPVSATTATLRTTADSPATITVTCNVVDDRGVEASQTATVSVR